MYTRFGADAGFCPAVGSSAEAAAAEARKGLRYFVLTLGHERAFVLADEYTDEDAPSRILTNLLYSRPMEELNLCRVLEIDIIKAVRSSRSASAGP